MAKNQIKFDLENCDSGIRYCDGKACYDKRGAQTVKNIREKEDGIDLRIYQCPLCNMWHLTKILNWLSKEKHGRIKIWKNL